MLSNRSVPPCTVIPVLYHPDPGAAADWLCAAFGFTVRMRIANHRIQMRAGDGCLIVAEKPLPVAGENSSPTDAPTDRSHGVLVRITDVINHCERARQHGARILTEPRDHFYGER